MNKKIFFSIIMPTYNSERTIEKALSSIRNQKIDQDSIEILVIDGGSQDKTIEIAKKYGAIILFNKERVPEAAKRIGFRQAKGVWIIKQDSDEVYVNDMQLINRKCFIDHNPNIYCLLTDRLLPGDKCGIACAYLNYYGDPFSYIVYKIRGSVIKENSKYIYKKTPYGNIYKCEKDGVYPIGDGGGSALNIEKFRKIFGDKYDSQEYVNLSTQKILENTYYWGCIPGDDICHYSNAEFKTYLKKIRFKIHFNLNGENMLGYASKAKNNEKYNRRKWRFVLYAISVFFPLIDSIRMAILHKDASFLLHFLYTYYVLIVAIIEMIKKKDKGVYSYG